MTGANGLLGARHKQGVIFEPEAALSSEVDHDVHVTAYGF
jgi:hypothetical protein